MGRACTRVWLKSQGNSLSDTFTIPMFPEWGNITFWGNVPFLMTVFLQSLLWLPFWPLKYPVVLSPPLCFACCLLTVFEDWVSLAGSAGSYFVVTCWHGVNRNYGNSNFSKMLERGQQPSLVTWRSQRLPHRLPLVRQKQRIYLQGLAQCLAHGKHSINVS